ncbi:hypothetical protein JCM11251_004944 [Rhodosporidiobolus azoricus]
MPPKSTRGKADDLDRSTPASASSSTAPLPAVDAQPPPAAVSPAEGALATHAPPLHPGFYDPRLLQAYAGYPYTAHPPPPGFPFSYPSATFPGGMTVNDSPASSVKKRSRTETPTLAGGDEADEGEEGPGGSRKKRLPLSCGECQRRKIKCDRKVPCGACVRRKRTDYCSFDDEDPVTPYALNSDVRAIQRRLTHLEHLFHQQAPHVFAPGSGPPHAPPLSFPPSTGTSAHHPSPMATTASHPSPALPSHMSASATSHTSPAYPSAVGTLPTAALDAGGAEDEDLKQSPSVSDTEDAVADLEEKTFEARVPVLQALHAAAEQNVKRYNYTKTHDMELTTALTSILAEPLSFDQDGRPRSAVRLGLDLAVSTHDLPAVRRDAMAQIFAVLPDEEIAKFLIGKYFDEVEWDFRCLDPIAFPIEHARFVLMKSQSREDLIDPLWIAVFCMVLALSLEAFWSRPKGSRDMRLFRGLPEADLRELPSVWHDAALRALQIGEWGGTPRIRTVQAVILMTQYIQIASSSGQQGRILGWVASAIRVAQRMGLHRLGQDREKMPPDDPALPPGKNAVKRETALRLWWMLVCVDSWLSDSPSLRCYLLHPSQYNTALPLNLNFLDLSRSDWHTPVPQPLTVYTDASFELAQIKIAEQVRRTLDTLVNSGDGFSYPAVLEQDKLFRAVLENVPDVFSSEEVVPIDSPRIAYQRACLHEDVFSRIVRLNRPLLGRGYSPRSPYQYSTEQCIEAAKAVILSNHQLLQIETSRWWMYTGTLASSFVIMMGLFFSLDHDAPDSEIKEKRDVLLKAREIFDSQVATPALTVVVEEGRKLLAALFVEEERRRTARAAHTLAGAPPPALESFAQVLKRVSREIAAKDQPNTAGLVPSSLSRHVQPSASSLAAPLPPFSFAQAAATAMANTPTSFDAFTSSQPHSFGTPPSAAAALPSAFDGQDFSSSFFSGVANSEDWISGFNTSPGGDDSALLDQLAATW